MPSTEPNINHLELESIIMAKTPPDWALVFAQVYGIPPNQINKFIDHVQKRAGEMAEIEARAQWLGLEYGIKRRSQKKGFGGYDFLLEKMSPPYTKHLPRIIHLEVKINKSQLTKKQRVIRAEVIAKGQNFEVDRYPIALPLFA